MSKVIIRSREDRLLMFKSLITEKREGFIVDGSALQNALENSTQYNKWITRKISQVGLVENIDYIKYYGKTKNTKEVQQLDSSVQLNPNAIGGDRKLNIVLTVKATQRVAGKDKSEVGFELLDYLFDLSEIQLKEDSYRIDNPIDRAKRWIEEQEERNQLIIANEKKQLLIEEQKPKVDFYDTVATSKTAIEMSAAVKVLNMANEKGVILGRNNLFSILRHRGILRANNEPFQKYINSKDFRVIERKWTKDNGEEIITSKTLITQKGIDKIRKMLIKLKYEPYEEYKERKDREKIEKRRKKLGYTPLK